VIVDQHARIAMLDHVREIAGVRRWLSATSTAPANGTP
jgi:hypothetical protein